METVEKQSNQNERPVLTGEEADPIDLKKAAEWTANYRERYPDEVISYFFGINIIKEILSQEGCMGLRIYYANSKPLSSFQKFMLSISNFLRHISNAAGEKHLIIVGSDSNGHDQLPNGGIEDLKNRNNNIEAKSYATTQNAMYSGESNQEHIIAEQASPCPGAGCPKNALTER
jgi:hypothetical protein